MNSKEIFEKIESSITKALNKEDGIMLGGKKLTFKRMYTHGQRYYDAPGSDIEVYIMSSQYHEDMWYVDVHDVLYMLSAEEYCIEELKKTLEGAIISRNLNFDVENAFEIAITFNDGNCYYFQ